MLVLLSAILSFLGSGLPSLFNFLKDKQDKAHELAILKMQIDAQQILNAQRLQEIQMQANSAELIAIHNSNKPIGNWIDSLNASVRPVIAYLVFFSYFMDSMVSSWKGDYTWTEPDMVILTAVIGYFFGSRVFDKMK